MTISSFIPSPLDYGLPSHFTSFRQFDGINQFEISRDLALSEHRFRGLCAPPGAGKSAINVASSRILDASRTLYLTVNKSLQTQLVNEYSSSDTEFFNLVGHSSYPCMKNNSSHNLPMFDNDEVSECSAGPNCGYRRDVRRSLNYSHVSTNIANWVSIAKVGDPTRFGDFDYLILDEAHNLESILCGLLSLKFYERVIFDLLSINLPKMPAGISIWVSWGQEALDKCERELSISSREDERKGRVSSLTRKLSKLYKDLLMLSEISPSTVWVEQQISYPKGVSLTPAFASDYAEEYLFRGIKDIILSSATLGEEDFSYLGLGKNDYKLFDIDTGFDPARRPFYYYPTTTIDYRSTEGQIRQVINRMDNITDSRFALGWKGLIHSISYAHSEAICTRSRHKIISHRKDNAGEIISNWINSSGPSLISSPIMTEGVDLKGDLARFQFIWKVPTPDGRDPIIAARKKRNPKYPYYLAGKTLQQAVGRVNRGESDYGESYIFDKNWGNWMAGAISCPRYFKRAWKTIYNIPEPLDF